VSALLQACATTSDDYFDSPDDATLQATFQTNGEQLSNLRIAQQAAFAPPRRRSPRQLDHHALVGAQRQLAADRLALPVRVGRERDPAAHLVLGEEGRLGRGLKV
jgi:hypothetical protein